MYLTVFMYWKIWRILDQPFFISLSCDRCFQASRKSVPAVHPTPSHAMIQESERDGGGGGTHMMQRGHLTWHWKKGSDRRRQRNWRGNKRGPSSDSLFFSIELHGIQGFVCLFLCCSIFIVFMLCINFLELISRVLSRKRAGILHFSTPFLLPSGLPSLSLLHSKCREDKYWTGREEMGRERKKEKSPLLVDGSGIQQ